MIDIEYDVFDAVYSVLCEAESGEEPLVPVGNLSGVYVPAPESFPFVMLIEMDNTTDSARRSTAINEDFANVTYSADIFAMDKDECKRIASALDDKMISLGFTRISAPYLLNLEDPSIHRKTARYSAKVDQNKVIYKR